MTGTELVVKWSLTQQQTIVLVTNSLKQEVQAISDLRYTIMPSSDSNAFKPNDKVNQKADKYSKTLPPLKVPILNHPKRINKLSPNSPRLSPSSPLPGRKNAWSRHRSKSFDRTNGNYNTSNLSPLITMNVTDVVVIASFVDFNAKTSGRSKKPNEPVSTPKPVHHRRHRDRFDSLDNTNPLKSFANIDMNKVNESKRPVDPAQGTVVDFGEIQVMLSLTCVAVDIIKQNFQIQAGSLKMQEHKFLDWDKGEFQLCVPGPYGLPSLDAMFNIMKIRLAHNFFLGDMLEKILTRWKAFKIWKKTQVQPFNVSNVKKVNLPTGFDLSDVVLNVVKLQIQLEDDPVEAQLEQSLHLPKRILRQHDSNNIKENWELSDSLALNQSLTDFPQRYNQKNPDNPDNSNNTNASFDIDRFEPEPEMRRAHNSRGSVSGFKMRSRRNSFRNKSFAMRNKKEHGTTTTKKSSEQTPVKNNHFNDKHKNMHPKNYSDKKPSVPPLEWSPNVLVLHARYVNVQLKATDALLDQQSLHARVQDLDTCSNPPYENQDNNETNNSKRFAELWGRNLTLSMSKLQINLRDYPISFLQLPDVNIMGSIIFGQLACPKPLVQMIPVCLQPPYMIGVSKGSRIALKIYHDLHMDAKGIRLCYGPALSPALALLSRFGNMLSPSTLPKPGGPLGWWDNLRYKLHGCFSVSAPDCQLRLCSSMSPYDTSAMVLSTKQLRAIIRKGEVTIKTRHLGFNVELSQGLGDKFTQDQEFRPDGQLFSTPEFGITLKYQFVCHQKSNPSYHYIHHDPKHPIRQSKFLFTESTPSQNTSPRPRSLFFTRNEGINKSNNSSPNFTKTHSRKLGLGDDFYYFRAKSMKLQVKFVLSPNDWQLNHLNTLFPGKLNTKKDDATNSKRRRSTICRNPNNDKKSMDTERPILPDKPFNKSNDKSQKRKGHSSLLFNPHKNVNSPGTSSAKPALNAEETPQLGPYLTARAGAIPWVRSWFSSITGDSGQGSASIQRLPRILQPNGKVLFPRKLASTPTFGDLMKETKIVLSVVEPTIELLDERKNTQNERDVHAVRASASYLGMDTVMIAKTDPKDPEGKPVKDFWNTCFDVIDLTVTALLPEQEDPATDIAAARAYQLLRGNREEQIQNFMSRGVYVSPFSKKSNRRKTQVLGSMPLLAYRYNLNDNRTGSSKVKPPPPFEMNIKLPPEGFTEAWSDLFHELNQQEAQNKPGHSRSNRSFDVGSAGAMGAQYRGKNRIVGIGGLDQLLEETMEEEESSEDEKDEDSDLDQGYSTDDIAERSRTQRVSGNEDAYFSGEELKNTNQWEEDDHGVHMLGKAVRVCLPSLDDDKCACRGNAEIADLSNDTISKAVSRWLAVDLVVYWTLPIRKNLWEWNRLWKYKERVLKVINDYEYAESSSDEEADYNKSDDVGSGSAEAGSGMSSASDDEGHVLLHPDLIANFSNSNSRTSTPRGLSILPERENSNSSNSNKTSPTSSLSALRFHKRFPSSGDLRG